MLVGVLAATVGSVGPRYVAEFTTVCDAARVSRHQAGVCRPSLVALALVVLVQSPVVADINASDPIFTGVAFGVVHFRRAAGIKKGHFALLLLFVVE